jgi:REP element-mobilizing transposase RayT
MEVVMRQKRKLAEHVWYHVRTAINNREPVFQLLEAVVLLCRVLIEAKGKFPFEMCGLIIGDEWLSFYIKPADGYELPKIMQWMKQTFSCRFNVRTRRLAVMLLSSVAHSLPPHRGAVFKQRPQCFGRTVGWGTCGETGTGRRFCRGSRRRMRKRWTGGDACIQRGGFFAAAPWRSF